MVYHWEDRNKKFPHPSVFELTGRQRLTVKRGVRNVGQFLTAEVTNPGQNESQQMFAFCDRMDKEGDILDRDSSPNESPDRVKEEERGWMIGQNPKSDSSILSSAEIGKKGFSFEDRGRRERTRDLIPNSGRRSRAGVFRTAIDVIRWIETVAEIPGKSGKNLGQADSRRLQAKLYKNPASL